MGVVVGPVVVVVVGPGTVVVVGPGVGVIIAVTGGGAITGILTSELLLTASAVRGVPA